MEYEDQCINNNIDTWKWQEDAYFQRENQMNDISSFLLEELNHGEDNSMYMLEAQTPIRDCIDFDYRISEFEENLSKLLDESSDSPQRKRRRTLHFPSDAEETSIHATQFASAPQRYEERGDEQIDNIPLASSVNVEWNSQWNIGLKENNCNFNNSELLDQPPDAWFDSCFDECLKQFEADDAVVPPIQDMNFNLATNQQQVHVPERPGPYMVAKGKDFVQERSRPAILPKVLKGGKPSIRAWTKLTTSIAYPFAILKPCGVEGGVTLRDINQRIHSSPPPRAKHLDGSSYPTSAFSGKPVVVRTKIRTEGGKGSITIVRTKG